MQNPEDFIYNDREYEAYKKYENNGIEVPRKSVSNGEHLFIQNAMGEPKRIITKMIRVMQPDYSDKKQTRKDFLWYLERWEGVDFIGNPISPVNDHIEGCYDEPTVKRIINPKTNMPVKMTKTGPNGQIVQTEYDKLKVETVRRVYYIPFSKEKLDEILKETGNWENRDGITYKLKVSPSHTDDTFSYEQFANWDFKTAAAESLKQGGARANPYVPEIKSTVQKKTVQLNNNNRQVQQVEESLELP